MVCLALWAAPAAAQYGGDPPPPSAPPSGCPVADPPPPDPPPCQPREQASVSDPTVVPGQSITITTPPVFAPGSAVTVNLVRVTPDGTPSQIGAAVASGAGAVDTTATIPSVEQGVYFLYVVGQDAAGNRVVAMVPVVVTPQPAAAGAVAGAEIAPPVAAAAVPAEVAAVQSELAGDAEAEVVEAVAAGDAGLILAPDGHLELRGPDGTQTVDALATTGTDLTVPITAGAALVLAGAGLVLVNRRRGATR